MHSIPRGCCSWICVRRSLAEDAHGRAVFAGGACGCKMLGSMNANRTPTGQSSTRQIAFVVALICAYALVSHYSYSHTEAKGLGAGLSVGPIALIGIVLAWVWTPRYVAAALCIAILALLVGFWPFLETHYQWSDLVQQSGAYAFVALGFARSLLPARVPACTQLAAQLHGELAPAEIAYTRRATWVWAIFYGLLSVAIVAVFFAASAHIWSLFVNFGTFALIGIVFFADHALRYRVLPRRAGGIRATVLQALTGAGPAARPPE